MFEIILAAVVFLTLVVLILRVDQKVKEMNRFKKDAEFVVNQAEKMTVTGNELNRKKAAQIDLHAEVRGVHLEALDIERKLLSQASNLDC